MTEDPFVTHRGLLFTVAYEMLGSAADAEDVLQESWLRWADVDQSHVSDPRAYLIREGRERLEGPPDRLGRPASEPACAARPCDVCATPWEVQHIDEGPAGRVWTLAAMAGRRYGQWSWTATM